MTQIKVWLALAMAGTYANIFLSESHKHSWMDLVLMFAIYAGVESLVSIVKYLKKD